MNNRLDKKWFNIPGYVGYYQINKKGEVKSLSRKVFNGYDFYKTKEKILSKSVGNNGYRCNTLYRDSKQKTIIIHRVLAKMFIPNPENKKCINHKDGNKLNNKLENLEWCTYSENMYHAVQNGLNKPLLGEEKHNAKLTEKQVFEIRKKYVPKKYTQKMLAKEYNCSITNIGFIVNNKTWKHVER